MIGRRTPPSTQNDSKPKGFEDFELRLGDLMRGERATLSKSLLDVQRELRIKAGYIAAIEAADVSAFDTPSFVAGYVRSYARYLGLDSDWAFERFCFESGFTPTHGMAPQASGPKPQRSPSAPVDALANPNAVFVPKTEGFWSQIELRAVGSVLVLAALVGGIGYGGWTVLQEVQRVQLSPVDQSPDVIAELDPLSGVDIASAADPVRQADARSSGGLTDNAADRLFRPAALDVPVMIARDGPIAAIDPTRAGVFSGGDTRQLLAQNSAPAPSSLPGPQPAAGGLDQGSVDLALAQALGAPEAASGVVRTTAQGAADVQILAVRPSWVRVSAADGSVLLEKIMDAGERYTVPKLAEPAKLRTGESGAIYFAVNGEAHGPVGSRGAVTKNIVLSPDVLSEKYAVADPASDAALSQMFSVADATDVIGLDRPKTD